MKLSRTTHLEVMQCRDSKTRLHLRRIYHRRLQLNEVNLRVLIHHNAGSMGWWKIDVRCRSELLRHSQSRIRRELRQCRMNHGDDLAVWKLIKIRKLYLLSCLRCSRGQSAWVVGTLCALFSEMSGSSWLIEWMFDWSLDSNLQVGHEIYSGGHVI